MTTRSDESRLQPSDNLITLKEPDNVASEAFRIFQNRYRKD